MNSVFQNKHPDFYLVVSHSSILILRNNWVFPIPEIEISVRYRKLLDSQSGQCRYLIDISDISVYDIVKSDIVSSSIRHTFVNRESSTKRNQTVNSKVCRICQILEQLETKLSI